MNSSSIAVLCIVTIPLVISLVLFIIIGILSYKRTKQQERIELSLTLEIEANIIINENDTTWNVEVEENTDIIEKEVDDSSKLSREDISYNRDDQNNQEEVPCTLQNFDQLVPIVPIPLKDFMGSFNM